MADLDLNADPVENHDGQSSGEDLTLASLRQHPFDLNVFPDEHYACVWFGDGLGPFLFF